MDLSVGDIAEQIMAQGARTRGVKAPTFTPDPSVYSNKVGAQAPDISEIEVPLDFVSSIVEGKDQVVEAKVSPTPPASPISEDTELKTLIHELKDLLIEVKQSINEMTAAGSIGVNMAGPEKKEKEEDPMEALLRKVRKKRSSK
tara:strand:+ start:3826 stop:4257 length:432 start_codon:yes stop_codon:yes gene_type:complete